MIKVIVVLAVVAVVGGLGVKWAKDKAESVIHHTIDTALPAKVADKPWIPLSHGRRVRADRVEFSAGHLTTKRCHVALGSYSIHVDHAFHLQRTTTPIPSRCPGRSLRAALGHAVRVDVEAHGKGSELTFTNKKGRTVATLVSAH
ncbi:MAG: hypothetical protein WB797_18830 [Nocardioides sp.]